MCGIAGYFRLASQDASTAGHVPDLERMTRRLVHRGPDSEGFHREPGVGLGMRRLRVIDLETGEQPIANETGEVQVVQNGEIYNFRELRTELESKGHHFATRSDTEVLVHGWEEWGEVKDFRGPILLLLLYICSDLFLSFSFSLISIWSLAIVFAVVHIYVICFA